MYVVCAGALGGQLGEQEESGGQAARYSKYNTYVVGSGALGGQLGGGVEQVEREREHVVGRRVRRARVRSSSVHTAVQHSQQRAVQHACNIQ